MEVADLVELYQKCGNSGGVFAQIATEAQLTFESIDEKGCGCISSDDFIFACAQVCPELTLSAFRIRLLLLKDAYRCFNGSSADFQRFSARHDVNPRCALRFWGELDLGESCTGEDIYEKLTQGLAFSLDELAVRMWLSSGWDTFLADASKNLLYTKHLSFSEYGRHVNEVYQMKLSQQELQTSYDLLRHEYQSRVSMRDIRHSIWKVCSDALCVAGHVLPR